MKIGWNFSYEMLPVVVLVHNNSKLLCYKEQSDLIIAYPFITVPTMQFAYTQAKIEEKAGLVHIPIIRNGDLSFESSVRCFTRQRSAQVMMDFDERRNTDDFRVVFLPGDKVRFGKYVNIME